MQSVQVGNFKLSTIESQILSLIEHQKLLNFLSNLLFAGRPKDFRHSLPSINKYLKWIETLSRYSLDALNFSKVGNEFFKRILIFKVYKVNEVDVPHSLKKFYTVFRTIESGKDESKVRLPVQIYLQPCHFLETFSVCKE